MKIYTTDSEAWTYNGRCDKCGKPYIYVGDVPPYGFTKGQEPYCTCNQKNYDYAKDGNDYNFNFFSNKGWTCPKCGRVFAPSIVECIYCNGVSISSVWMTSSSSGSDTYSRNLGDSSTDTVTLDEDDDIQFSFTNDKDE